MYDTDLSMFTAKERKPLLKAMSILEYEDFAEVLYQARMRKFKERVLRLAKKRKTNAKV